MRHSQQTLGCAAISLLAVAVPACADDVIWDFGPGTGDFRDCQTNMTEMFNWADSVLFGEFVELTGIDMWTCEPMPLGDMHIKILLTDPFLEWRPGEDFIRFDMDATSYTYDGKYNGTDLYKVSFDFDPILLRADTVYWIGVSGNGWELGQARIETPGNGEAVWFRDREFERVSENGDLMFQLRGHAVFPPFELALEGACPGEMTANIIGGTPSGSVAILRGQRGGQTIITSGPCKGAVIPLGNAQLVDTVTPKADGSASLTFDVPDNLCGSISFAALDLSTCEVTLPARTYDVPELYLGEQITFTEGFADFNKESRYRSSRDYDEGGVNVRYVHTELLGFRAYEYCNGNGTPSIYDVGPDDMIGLRRTDSQPIDAVEFMVGDGYISHCSLSYVWVRAYLEGVPIADYTIDLSRFAVLGFAGGQFDELRIGAYSFPQVRDRAYKERNERARNQSLCLDNVRIGTINLGPILSLTGSCPGNMTAQVINATPRSTVALIFALRNGQYTIPNGPCAGTVLPIAGSVQLIATTGTDNQGRANITGTVPPSACGHRLVVVDVASCQSSNVERIE